MGAKGATGPIKTLRLAWSLSDRPRAEQIGFGLFLAAMLAFPWVVKAGFARAVAVQFMLYALYGTSWNAIGGFGGQVDLGAAKSVGFGAYAVALLTSTLDAPFWAVLPVAVAAAMLESFVVGAALLRLRGHYFAIGTLAVALVWQELFVFWEWTGGARGINLPIKPAPDWAYLQLDPVGYHYVALGLLLAGLLVVNGIRRSRLGYQLRALRANEEAAASVGVDVFAAKLKAYVTSAALYAAGGAFYAAYFGYIDPFSVMPMDLSVMIAMTAMLGGAGAMWGPLIGAAVLVPLDRYLGAWLGGHGVQGIDFLVYSVVIMALAAYQPKGVWGIIASIGKVRRARGASRCAVAGEAVRRGHGQRLPGSVH
ncbi:branched-chain amino acid ABC transporter permease [Carboxydochorda subterranea]|uniref:Branched-chain amino acid ABC transporter permease n=1 Tax=Carboxydichorda subterranea TaxID=3109565 RepID=A0ABZ1BZH5_9FIRM|nr:branched-chain amino acid ABC transporter permease [Limnochorda sp. L945t]WRP17945.1 branched-chain amino acid ABC transporter permease [Limnochorda sp. L945t]